MLLLVWALLLAQWGLTLLSLRLQSTRTATSFPLWPAVIALHWQLHSNPSSQLQPWRDAHWLAALIPILISAVSEMLFRKAFADRLAALRAAPAPPREAPSISYRYKMVSLDSCLSVCLPAAPADAVTCATVADRMRPTRPRLVRLHLLLLHAGILIHACAMCSGGELLKLVDVSAGLVAAKHARGPCLTISVDRVIFLQEIRVGDVISISSAVNRAWGRYGSILLLTLILGRPG